MKLKIIQTDRHRNGVAGTPFEVVLFKVAREQGRKVAILFDEPGNCAVLDVNLLAAGDIAFGSNSWRGDEYEPALRAAIGTLPMPANNEADIDNARRCNLFADILKSIQGRSGDDREATVVDLLADARHWCDANGKDFYEFDRIAYRHYLAELNDERKMP